MKFVLFRRRYFVWPRRPEVDRYQRSTRRQNSNRRYCYRDPLEGFHPKVEIRGSDNVRDAYVIRMDGLIADVGGAIPLSSLKLTILSIISRHIYLRILDGDQPPLKIDSIQCCPPDPEAPWQGTSTCAFSKIVWMQLLVQRGSLRTWVKTASSHACRFLHPDQRVRERNSGARRFLVQSRTPGKRSVKEPYFDSAKRTR